MSSVDNWRLYSFTNFYLSPLQYGLQTAHCAVELVTHWSSTARGILPWVGEDKTIIILNGGAQVQLEATYNTLKELYQDLGLPYQQFKEDEGLNFALTCVCVLVPASIYEMPLPEGEPQTPEERMRVLISCPLAR